MKVFWTRDAREDRRMIHQFLDDSPSETNKERQVQTDFSAILIAGTSHVGKTSLAHRLATALGWKVISTDSLGRHPGRPWPDINPAVAEYYGNLSAETIQWFLKVHHENMWPALESLIHRSCAKPEKFISEGAALRPEYIAPLAGGGRTCICLYADPGVLEARMQLAANYRQVDAVRRGIIDKFIERSLRENAELRLAAQEHAMRLVDSTDFQAIDALFDELVRSAAR